MRSVKSELLGLTLIAALPAAIAVIFPYEALTIRPGAKSGNAANLEVAGMQFVELSPATEKAVIESARSLWKLERKGVKHTYRQLTLGEIPEDDRRIAKMNFSASEKEVAFASGHKPSAWLPSSAAEKLSPVKATLSPEKTSAFSREELLELH